MTRALWVPSGPGLPCGARELGDASGVTGDIRPLAHEYVPPLGGADAGLMAVFGASADMCLACGMPQDGTGPRGEQLHT